MILTFVALFSWLTLTSTTNDIPNPEELGQVKWLRNYDQAIQQSEQTGKPILILFQEVPGCSTCRRYGKQVLSHPLIVDAIENEFVPLAIHNNKGGADKKVLKSFGEPAWNNPVVRIIDAKRKALTPRIAAQYTRYDLVKGMQNALKNAGKQSPEYLQLLTAQLESEALPIEKATFGMYCFWSGESKLGGIDGVVSSEPGFMGGSEVVTVEFNPEVISYEQLTKQAAKQGCSDRVFAHTPTQASIAKKQVTTGKVKEASKFRPDREPQYYLSKSTYRFLPLLPIQASRINARIAQGRAVGDLLSPTQQRFHQYIKQHPNKKWKSYYHEKHFAANWENLAGKIN